MKIIGEQNNEDIENEEEEAATSIAALELSDRFDIFANYDQELATDNLADNGLKKRVEKEMICYKAAEMAKNPSKVDVLEWWKQQAEIFPLLSKAARFIFGIHAGSSATENCFSSAGFIFSDRRTNMKPKRLEDLLLLRCNRDLKVNGAMIIAAHDEYYDSEDGSEADSDEENEDEGNGDIEDESSDDNTAEHDESDTENI